MANINYSAISSAQSFLAAPNTATSGWFWAGMLFMVVLVSMISMIGFGIEVAMLVALFIGIIAGTFLLYAGLISAKILGMLVAAELLLVIYVVIMNPRNN